MDVGILHPGLMGETLASNCSLTTLWAGHGRSVETQARAQSHGMVDMVSLVDLAARAGAIISICPPGAALELAAQVAATGFSGMYVDANAISSSSARQIAGMFEHFVDGSLIGPPAHTPGTTRMYLSGQRAEEVAGWYQGSALDARVISDEAGAASALKMAYASWTKIGSAMNLAIRALAQAEGIDEALVAEWELSQPGAVERSDRVARHNSPKAWRFTGEMAHIASSFEDAGLPPGFAAAADEIYNRLAGFKGESDVTLDQVVEALNNPSDQRSSNPGIQ